MDSPLDKDGLLQTAVQFAQEQNFEKALEAHIAYQNLSQSLAFQDLDIIFSHSLSLWCALARKYRPALLSLYKFREDLEFCATSAPDNLCAVMKVAYINYYLKEVALTEALFLKLRVNSPIFCRDCADACKFALFKSKLFNVMAENGIDVLKCFHLHLIQSSSILENVRRTLGPSQAKMITARVCEYANQLGKSGADFFLKTGDELSAIKFESALQNFRNEMLTTP